MIQPAEYQPPESNVHDAEQQMVTQNLQRLVSLGKSTIWFVMHPKEAVASTLENVNAAVGSIRY